jgi:hypothetical protein
MTNNKTIFLSHRSSEELAYSPLQVVSVFCLSETVHCDIKILRKATYRCATAVSRVLALAVTVNWHLGSPKLSAAFWKYR